MNKYVPYRIHCHSVNSCLHDYVASGGCISHQMQVCISLLEQSVCFDISWTMDLRGGVSSSCQYMGMLYLEADKNGYYFAFSKNILQCSCASLNELQENLHTLPGIHCVVTGVTITIEL